jgi:PmbA protein
VEKVLSLASDRSIECEIYGERAESFQVEVFGGEIESIDRSREAGLGLRVVSAGRVGSAWTCDLTAGGLAAVLAEAGSNALSGDETDADVLAQGEGLDEPAVKESGNLDGMNPEMKIEGALAMEAAALASDRRVRSSESASYTETAYSICVAGTRGFIRTRRGGYCACSIGAAAASGGEVRSGWSYAQATSPEMLDFQGTGREAGARSAGLLGGTPLQTGRYAVLFDSLAFSEIVSLLGEVLSAEMVVRGSSVFRDRLGERVASGKFTLVDDPFLPGGCFNAPFDDEGVCSAARRLVSEGILASFLHNSYTARKTGQGRAGNAFRGTFKGVPVPGPTNLFVAAGRAGTKELLENLGKGIYIQDVMGMHTADPVSGDFSVGISGFEVRGGEMGRAVCEMTISGNVLSLLGGIVATGNAVRFAGQVGSPAVLVDGLSVSGR